jgi:pimeloyl-ACP methyl ester carboxylesterase
MADDYVSRYVNVQGVKTHFLEAGAENDETLVLIHPGEYGASAELSWQPNIGVFAEEYHVIAPDLIGFGHTDKIFDFEDAFDRRIEHLSAFLDVMDVEEADFIGNSMGGGYLASLACEEPPLSLPIRKMILISGGGGVPDGFGEIIRDFDGTEAEMEKIVDMLFHEPEKLGDGFLERKTEESRIPGHWQSLSAIRFEPPFEQDREFRRRHDYENIDVPTLLVGGREDDLKPPEEIRKLGEQIPDARVEILDDCAHCAHMEQPETFNELAFEFFDV